MASETPASSEAGASSRPDVVDLDALRAQRLEAAGEHKVMFGGRTFLLEPEVPFAFAEVWSTDRTVENFRLLFTDDDEAEAFFALKPSVSDINAILGSYGTSAGK